VGVLDSTEQVRVHDGRVSSVETRVRHVDGEAEGGSEALRRKPCGIARTARRVAGQVSGHDLGAPLVVQLRHAGGLDRHHGGVGGESRHLVRAQVEELRAHVHRGQVRGQLRPVPRRLGAYVRTGRSGHRLDGHTAALRPALDLVGRAQGGGGTYRGV
jgi:hypothetical protein